nr:peptidase_S74, L-shaped tail fiber protein [Sicyoidochytrium minutum DNA virus]
MATPDWPTGGNPTTSANVDVWGKLAVNNTSSGDNTSSSFYTRGSVYSDGKITTESTVLSDGYEVNANVAATASFSGLQMYDTNKMILQVPTGGEIQLQDETNSKQTKWDEDTDQIISSAVTVVNRGVFLGNVTGMQQVGNVMILQAPDTGGIFFADSTLSTNTSWLAVDDSITSTGFKMFARATIANGFPGLQYSQTGSLVIQTDAQIEFQNATNTSVSSWTSSNDSFTSRGYELDPAASAQTSFPGMQYYDTNKMILQVAAGGNIQFQDSTNAKVSRWDEAGDTFTSTAYEVSPVASIRASLPGMQYYDSNKLVLQAATGGNIQFQDAANGKTTQWDVDGDYLSSNGLGVTTVGVLGNVRNNFPGVQLYDGGNLVLQGASFIKFWDSTSESKSYWDATQDIIQSTGFYFDTASATRTNVFGFQYVAPGDIIAQVGNRFYFQDGTNSRLTYWDEATDAFSSVAYQVVSDRRKKSNIRDVTDEEADRVFEKLHPRHFRFDSTRSLDSDPEEEIDLSKPVTREKYGFIAQEVREVLPEAVQEAEDGLLSVDESQLIPILFKKISMLEREIKTLRERLG